MQDKPGKRLVPGQGRSHHHVAAARVAGGSSYGRLWWWLMAWAARRCWPAGSWASQGRWLHVRIPVNCVYSAVHNMRLTWQACPAGATRTHVNMCKTHSAVGPHTVYHTTAYGTASATNSAQACLDAHMLQMVANASSFERPALSRASATHKAPTGNALHACSACPPTCVNTTRCAHNLDSCMAGQACMLAHACRQLMLIKHGKMEGAHICT